MLDGFHHENGIEYGKGQVVKSDRDLCAKFKNKFREEVAPLLRPELVVAQAVEQESLSEAVEPVAAVESVDEPETVPAQGKRSRRRK